MSKIFVDQVDPRTATTLTLGTTGDTVSIPSGVTLSGAGTITASAANLAASGAGGVTGTLPIANGGTGATAMPAFSAYLGSNQTPSVSTYTKVAIDTEYYDTDSAFDKDTNYRFTVPSGSAGNYFFYGKVEYTAVTANSRLMAVFYLNGVAVNQGRAQTSPGGTTDNYAQVSWSVNLSESDYVELWTYYSGESGTRTFETPKCTFTGNKIT